jgi:hypothetical protein
MFLTNSDIVNKLNLVYANNIKRTNNLSLPDKEDILIKLHNRDIILFHYLSTSEIGSDDDGVPQINLNLRKFFAYPFGDKFWVDDASFQVLADNGYIIPQDICNEIITNRYNKFTQLKLDKKSVDFTEFSVFLNQLYENKFAD